MPTFTVNDLKLHFLDEGQGEPVVLVHGFPLSAEMWRPQRAMLSDHYRVLSVELRGFGRSDVPSGPLSMATYADDVMALLDALGIGQACVAGLSMGGYIVMALLRRHPERLGAVMLLDTRMTPDTATGRQNRNEMITLARQEGPAAVADAMLPKMLTDRTMRDNPALVDYVRDMMVKSSVPGITGALAALRDRPDSTETLKKAAVPVLVLVGGADTLTPPADAEAMHKVLGRSQLVTVPDAAHLSTLEQPAPVNEAIHAFLQTL